MTINEQGQGQNERNDNFNHLRADCGQCLGLCCVALPFAQSADFAMDKMDGVPCSNLQADYTCRIHKNLRNSGYRGCTVYECFGAGQKVSQLTFSGLDWRKDPEIANQMFMVFPIMQQLHEMLLYLNEAVSLVASLPYVNEIQAMLDETERLTQLDSEAILKLDIPAHRTLVNNLLLLTSERVRSEGIKRNNSKRKRKSFERGANLIGAKLCEANLRGSNLRGAYLIATDLRGADIRDSDFIGADFRDANLSGADLRGSIFLTQAQLNAAKGDLLTKLPQRLNHPAHWL